MFAGMIKIEELGICWLNSAEVIYFLHLPKKKKKKKKICCIRKILSLENVCFLKEPHFSLCIYFQTARIRSMTKPGKVEPTLGATTSPCSTKTTTMVSGVQTFIPDLKKKLKHWQPPGTSKTLQESLNTPLRAVSARVAATVHDACPFPKGHKISLIILPFLRISRLICEW